MNYKVLDSENGVVACCLAEIPEEHKEDIVKQGGELARLTFYFDKEQDLVVLNEDSDMYEFYAEIVQGILSLTEEKILKMHENLPEKTRDTFESMLTILLAVKRYRVLKEGSRYAEE